ncbi:MAG: PAS domain-containing sensor histidine kinase [Victivallaceae bacterium]|nr:PAS domain-containing sensor histidine kinase [Victivallaceae bacterium]
MINENVISQFADPAREAAGRINQQVAVINDVPMIHQLVDLVPDAFLILNEQRQIVFCNKTFADVLNLTDYSDVYGLKPGEALNCIHAGLAEGGCGTTEHCVYCGAVNSILNSQDDHTKPKSAECNIMRNKNSAMNFRVWAKNLTVDEEDYTIFIARDISDAKRRSILEHIFFHDILNTAGGIQGVVSLLDRADEDKLNELIDLVNSASETLIEEIKAQKDILAAESGELKVQSTILNTLNMLNAVYKIYIKHEVALDRNIKIAEDAASVDLKSDPRLIKRIIGNMLKNALEASADDETVTIGVRQQPEGVEFWVHNSNVMPDEAKMQVFKRSFSTKGNGRGLGTYSIKLLGEKYLKGKVSFESEEDKGTIFSFTLPLTNA